MHTPTFTRKPVAQGIALALGVTAMAPALAQDSEAIEEIMDSLNVGPRIELDRLQLDE